MLHHRLGLLIVGGADVHHQWLVRLAEKFDAGERADHGNAGIGRNRLDRGGGRRADGADDREYLVLLQQLLDHTDRACRLVAVIDALEFELASLDAAGLVDFGEGGFEPDLHVLPQGRCRTGQRGGLAKYDSVGRNTVLGVGRRQIGNDCSQRHQRHLERHGKFPWFRFVTFDRVGPAETVRRVAAARNQRWLSTLKCKHIF